MDKYKLLLDAVTTALKDRGFVKKGTTFYYYKENNWGLLNFQKSQSSTKDEIIFTLNIGIVSTLLRKNIDHDNSISKPEMGHYHWETRIGFLMPDKDDYWWRIDASEELDNIIIDVVSAVKNLAIPAIEEHISDESLINTWINGGGGTSLINSYIYLTTLLKLKGDKRLSKYVQEMLDISRKRPIETFAIEHFKFLNSF